MNLLIAAIQEAVEDLGILIQSDISHATLGNLYVLTILDVKEPMMGIRNLYTYLSHDDGKVMLYGCQIPDPSNVGLNCGSRIRPDVDQLPIDLQSPTLKEDLADTLMRKALWCRDKWSIYTKIVICRAKT